MQLLPSSTTLLPLLVVLIIIGSVLSLYSSLSSSKSMFRCYKRLAPIVMQINNRLTPAENNLFDIVLKSIKFNPSKSNTVARVAGGWVRDKLLGRESDDIDIALDNQSGEEFARNINTYLKSLGQKTSHIAVIQANPDQSKHLETANVKILNFLVDCVNLRSEEYANNSRIPEIRPGTALEDAMRRDFTINALFYNLNEKEVEDLTGMGVNDLRDGLIRTPLDPLHTFNDDPLRVLRAIRFASRFNFTLHPEIVSASLHPLIQRSILEKVSRERVLKECDGMFRGSSCRPYLAIVLIHRLNMFDAIFQLPEEVSSKASVRSLSPLLSELGGDSVYSSYSVEEDLSKYKVIGLETARWCNILLALTEKVDNTKNGVGSLALPGRSGGTSSLQEYSSRSNSNPHIFANEVSSPRDGHRSLFFAACNIGLKHLVSDNTYIPSIILGKFLKMDGDTVKQVFCLHVMSQAFRLLLRSTISTDSTNTPQNTASAVLQFYSDPNFQNRPDVSEFRMWVGLTLRSMVTSSPYSVDKDSAIYLWRYALLLACAEDLANIHVSSPPPPAAEYTPSVEGVSLSSEAVSIIDSYGILQAAIEKMSIDQAVWTLKPLLDGNKVINELEIARGAGVSQVMEEQARWQLRYSNGTVDDLREHLKVFVVASGIPMKLSSTKS